MSVLSLAMCLLIQKLFLDEIIPTNLVKLAKVAYELLGNHSSPLMRCAHIVNLIMLYRNQPFTNTAKAECTNKSNCI